MATCIPAGVRSSAPQPARSEARSAFFGVVPESRVPSDGAAQKSDLLLELTAAFAYAQMRSQAPALQPPELAVLGDRYQLRNLSAVQHGNPDL